MCDLQFTSEACRLALHAAITQSSVLLCTEQPLHKMNEFIDVFRSAVVMCDLQFTSADASMQIETAA
jgi:hypothetical protein